MTKVLFISRKNNQGYGGLSRFYAQLSSFFPKSTLKPDIIHLCDTTLLPLGILLKLILQKPLTLTVHGLDIIYPNKLYQMMLKFLLPKADALVAVSSPTLSLLTRFNLKKSIIFVIPNGISIAHLDSPNPSNHPYHPNLKGKIFLLTVNNLVLRKGHVWFLRKVFRKLPSQFVYLIVGEGSQRNNIEQTIRRLHLQEIKTPGGWIRQAPRVILTGRLTDQQLAYLYKLADIYVCPNQHINGDFEGFGISVGEAAAMGLPVVASNVDGIPQVIKNGKNGILVEPIPQAFIKAIIRLKNPTLRKQLGQKAKIYTRKNYDWQKTARQYLKVFQSIT